MKPNEEELPTRSDIDIEPNKLRLDDHKYMQRGYMIECDGTTKCPWHFAHGESIGVGKMLVTKEGKYAIVNE